MRTLRIIAACLILFAGAAYAQQSVRERGIEAYKQGRFDDAISSLEAVLKQKSNQADAEAWTVLGLSYYSLYDYKEARKALEKAVKAEPQNSTYNSNLAFVYLYTRQVKKAQGAARDAIRYDPNNATAYYILGTSETWEGDLDDAEANAEKALAADPAYPQAYLLKSDILMARLGDRLTAGSNMRAEVGTLKQMVQVLETGVERSKGRAGSDVIAVNLEAARVIHDHYTRERSDTGIGPPAPEPGVTPVQIIRKSPARYTENARAARVQGTIRLVLVLGANGRVLHVLKLKGLGYGLDEEAIKAARNIQFVPKMKDGKPVSTVVTVEYGFSIY